MTGRRAIRTTSTRMTGGSSGGSGAAVGGGLTPLALGSDTNGSIRVPSSLCGIFGLKPTYGRLSRAETFPFVASLDHLGPFARSVGDLAASYDAMQGADPLDPAQTPRPLEPTLAALGSRRLRLRIGQLGGYFAQKADAGGVERGRARRRGAGRRREVELPEAARGPRRGLYHHHDRGRGAARDRLKARAADYDPDVRDRLIAGAMLPGAWSVKAQKFRRWLRERALAMFRRCRRADRAGDAVQRAEDRPEDLRARRQEMLVRPNLGLFTQPISFIGLPVVAVPVWHRRARLPIGVQIIAAPWREDLALRVARALERDGVAAAPIGEGAR